MKRGLLALAWALLGVAQAQGLPPLRWAAQNDVLTLDPHSQNHATTLSLLQHSYEGLNTPSVWRSARAQAAAKVDALASNGMEEIEIPAFLRKQAD